MHCILLINSCAFIFVFACIWMFFGWPLALNHHFPVIIQISLMNSSLRHMHFLSGRLNFLKNRKMRHSQAKERGEISFCEIFLCHTFTRRMPMAMFSSVLQLMLVFHLLNFAFFTQLFLFFFLWRCHTKNKFTGIFSLGYSEKQQTFKSLRVLLFSVH